MVRRTECPAESAKSVELSSSCTTSLENSRGLTVNRQPYVPDPVREFAHNGFRVSSRHDLLVTEFDRLAEH